MKKWAILVLVLFSIPIQMLEVQAADSDWKEGEVIKGHYSNTERGQQQLVLEEDAKVTFILKDNEDLDLEYDYPNCYNVILFDKSGKRIANVTNNFEDKDLEKTIQSINLRKGSYQIIVSACFWAKGDYEVSYETSSIDGPDIEPNNEYASAHSYKIGTVLNGSVYSETSPNDFDVYKVEISTFGKLKLKMYDTGLDKTDIKLVAINEKDIKDKKDIEDIEDERSFAFKSYGYPTEIEVLIQPGTYYFKIGIEADNTPVVNYTLSTHLEPLDKNAWESGRNKNKENADVIQNNKKVKGFLYGGSHSYSESGDYYKFTLEKDAKVTFIANYREGFGALSFHDDARGTQLISGGYVTSDTGQIIETKQLKAGTYYVKFLPRYGIDRYEEYDLTIRIQRFTDVPAMHPYYESIEALAQVGINKGYPDGSFHPKEPVQRQHVFAFINRIEGLNIPKIRNMRSFMDVSTSQLFFPEIKKFYEAGIISGYGTYMGPSLNVSRGELAKILVNTFKLKMNGNGIPFKDVKSSNIFYNDIQILASNGITVGAYGNFMPNNPVTREQFSAFLHRILNQK
ncbi:S-layer homology domain-containing protein [Ureibacillus acetophenoni]|uniref:S-layer family protein n=1 Tax=Ureibacillus acetophenoni TaxID=614649 RepID=A0A285UMU2_9BACL|nr:S-layer homology domain-containing protein [Ureibacillus acetophenoni]SOC43200.1 S-layer family protein [Ureibacillus acetophenoni]